MLLASILLLQFLNCAERFGLRPRSCRFDCGSNSRLSRGVHGKSRYGEELKAAASRPQSKALRAVQESHHQDACKEQSKLPHSIIGSPQQDLLSHTSGTLT